MYNACRCRNVYVLLRQPKSAQPLVLPDLLKKEFIIIINTYILDTADMLWRMRAVSQQRPAPPVGARTYFDTVSHSVLQSVNVRHPNLAVSLLMHRAFVGFAMAFIEKVTPSLAVNFCSQGDQLSEKIGNVREFDSYWEMSGMS